MAAYSEDIATEICDRLASGESLESICRDDAMPCSKTVRRWRDGERGASDKFGPNYARARLDQADHYFDRLIDLADENAMHATSESTGAAKLQSDNIKWSLKVMNRAKYGDRSAVDLGNQPDNPLTASKEARAIAESLSPEARKAIRKMAHDDMQKGGGE